MHLYTYAQVAINTKMPGTPDGQYAIVNYHSTFSAKEQAVETVILRHEPDGVWRGAGYRVQ